MATGFGELLKEWRHGRRMSQMELGLAANVSARHIAFLETGRARPSRMMVLQLSETLQVPKRARNLMLTAAGFAEIYGNRTMNDADMEPIRAAVGWMLKRHDPYPAIALDRHWMIVGANSSATIFLEAVDLAVGDSLLSALTKPSKMREALDNWPEIVRHFIARLRIESAQIGGDIVLDDAVKILAEDAGNMNRLASDPLPVVVPTRYRFNGAVLSMFSTIAQFGAAEDIALADLKIELMFPADEATRSILMSTQTER